MRCDYSYIVSQCYKTKLSDKLEEMMDKIYDDEIQLSQKFKNDGVKKK